jgi:ribosomal-protein-serine acetyltransferase
MALPPSLSGLELRHWREDDAAALNRAVGESVEHLRPWMPWARDEAMSRAARVAWIVRAERERRAGGDVLYGVFLDGEVVGTGGLHRRIGRRALEIGYWVHVDYTRRGIATEVVRRLCAIAWSRPSVDHVEIHHDVENVASGGVAAAAGFVHVEDLPRPESHSGTGLIERIWRLDRPA